MNDSHLRKGSGARNGAGRTLILAALICLILAGAALASADQALLVLKSGNYADTEKTVTALEGIGCHAQHVIPPRVIIANVPPSAEAKAKALANVSALYRGQAPAYAIPQGLSAQSASDVKCGINAWNTLIEPPTAADLALANTGTPLVNDDVPETPTPQFSGPRAAATAASHAPGWNENSSFACGKVAIGVVFPESTGNGENWSQARLDTCFNKIVSGLNRWTTMGTNSRLTFYYDRHDQVSCAIEPIQYDEGLKGDWINQVMASMGYTTNTWNWRCRQYVNDIRASLHTDWAQMYFVVDCLNDADDCFPNGSFAWREGCCIFMTYNNDGWYVNNMDGVASHEIGHAFGASDEYCQTGNCCDFGYYGYLGVYNGNCEYNNPNSVDCKMKQNLVYTLCSWSKGQVGYQDSNSNGRYDVVDLTVNDTLNTITSPWNGSTVTFTGYSNITPCHSPSGWTEVTINKIVSVEYAIDGVWGYWATATDGAFNQDTEDYTATTPTLATGQHTFQTKVTDDWGNVGYSAIQNVQVNNADSTPPSTPTNLTADGTDYNTSHLTWTASTDNVGVTGYEIWRNGAALTTVGVQTAYDDTSCSGNTTYTYQVRARDAAANWSGLTSSVAAKTWVVIAQDSFASLSQWQNGPCADGTNRGVSLDSGTGNAAAPSARSDIGSGDTNGSYSYIGFAAPFAVANINVNFYDSATSDNSRNGLAFRKFNGAATRQVYVLGTDTFNTTNYCCDVYSAASGWNKRANGGARTVGWKRFRVAMDGTNVTYYVNGTLKDTIAEPAEKGEGIDRFYIGSNYNVNTTGWYDDFLAAAPTPLVPTVGAATGVTASGVTWNWTEGAKDWEQGFNVEDTGGVVKGTTARNVITFAESGLAANTAYTRRITAWNGTLESAQSGDSIATTLSVAPTTGNVTSTPATGVATTGVFTFTSTSPFGAGGVQYYRYVFDQSSTHTWTGSEAQWTSGTKVCDVTTPASNYYMHLKGYNSANVENGTLDLGPYVYAAPAAPTGVVATSSNYNVARLTWTASSDPFGVSNYEIWRNGSALTTVAGGVTAFDDSGLTQGTTYSYQVRAKNGANHWSDLTTSKSVKTWSVLLNDPFASMGSWTASKVADGTTRGCTLNSGAGSNLTGGSGAPSGRSDVGGINTNGSYSYNGVSGSTFAVGYIESSMYDGATSGNSRNGIALRKSTNDDISTPRLVFFLGVDSPNSATAYSCEAYGAGGGWVKHSTGGTRAIGWHRFRVNIDGTNITYYVDGTLKDTIAEPAEKTDGVNRWYIGNNYNVNLTANFDDFFTCMPTPPTPNAGTASGITSTSITWNFTEGPSDYEQGFYLRDTGGVLKGSAGRGATSVVESGLSPNTTYYRTISAYNGSLESAVSVTMSATTAP